MKENGHQVAIIAPGGSPLFEQAKQNGLMVYPISFKTLARVGEYGRLKQIFSSEQPFVVNAHGRGDARLALKAAQTTGVPCRIMSRHNGERVKYTWPNKKIYKTQCHYVFTTSKDSTRHLKQTFSLSDMHVFSIPDGIAMPDIHEIGPNSTIKANQAAGRQKLANTFGLRTDARFIGIFGRIDTPEIRLLDKIAHQVCLKYPFHHLVIAAPSENRGNMAEKTNDRVHVLPLQQENSADFYKALDCCVHFPNPQHFYQGVPGEMINAMAWFCPVIGADVPGLRDILIENKTGRVFDPAQPGSLPEIIGWTLNHSLQVQALAQTARALVEKHYTMDAMGRDILRIYRLHQVKIDRQLLMTP
nr:glycosyltransferase [uncultured Desulfobacter sp.]